VPAGCNVRLPALVRRRRCALFACPACAPNDGHLLVFIVQQNLVGIDAVVSAVTLFLHRSPAHVTTAMRKHNVIHKPEVHNVSQSPWRRTEPRPRVTCTLNFVKLGHVVSEICERTDRQTNKQAHHITSADRSPDMARG